MRGVKISEVMRFLVVFNMNIFNELNCQLSSSLILGRKQMDSLSSIRVGMSFVCTGFSGKFIVVCAVFGLSMTGVVTQAEAAFIRSAESVSYGGSSASSPNLMIDQSGLATTFSNGVTDFDSYDPANVFHDYQYGVGNINEWFADYPDPVEGEIVFDLGDEYTLDRIAFWNEDGEGILSVDVSFSLDGTTYGSAQNFLPTDNDWGVNYTADIFTLSSSSLARFVKFELTGDPSADDGYNNLSIGEVAFSVAEGVPEPATMILFGTGLLGLFGVRRRRKN
jgi:hypothetical protein